MKMKNLFNSEKGIRTVAIIVACVIVSVVCASVMISSKTSYDKYYKAEVSARDYKKYLNSLPLELEGISAELADGKAYYTDGLAEPKNDDLVVTAHFTEKGQKFDKILRSEAFDIDYPSDFKEKGGKIAVEYTFIPEKKNTEDVDPEPVVKTAEINVALTKVALQSIRLVQNPYRVYYSSAMEFSMDGMSCVAVYNNGQESVIPADKLVSETKGKLPVGKQKADVSFTLDGVTAKTEVPITVVSESSYSDGKVISVATEEKIVIADGTDISSLKIPLRAVYENGNKLLLDSSAYTITGNNDKASFAYNCVLTFALKENAAMTCKTIATVKYEKKAVDTNIVSAAKKQDGGITSVTDFKDNASISFSIASPKLAKGDFTVRIKNLSKEQLNLAKNCSLSVNGIKYYFKNSEKLSVSDEYIDYALPTALMHKGENAVKLYVANGAKLAIESFGYRTHYENDFFTSLRDYFEKTEEVDLSVAGLGDWSASQSKPYMHGLATDGKYVYGACTENEEKRGIVVKKYDMITGEAVAASKETPKESDEAHAGVMYIDGKIVTFMANGKKYYTNAALTDEWKEYDGLNFAGYEDIALLDAVYVEGRQTFVVRTSGRNIVLFDKQGNKKKQFSVESDSVAGLKRITANSDYIFAVYSADGVYRPVVRVYDYDGKFVKRFIVDYDYQTVLGSKVNKITKTNVQGIVALSDSLYFSIIKFAQDSGDGHYIFKGVTKSESGISLDFSEYAEAAKYGEASGNPTGELATDSIKAFRDTGWAMGGVSDGKYLYLSMFVQGWNHRTCVYKIDPETNDIIAKSAEISVGLNSGAGYNSRLFIHGGYIYCVPSSQRAGKLYRLELKKFEKMAEFEECNIPFAEFTTLKDAEYNADVNRFAVIANGALHLYDSAYKSIRSNIALSYAGMNVASVTSDSKFIYVSYYQENQTIVPVDVFDWDGNKVSTVSVSGISLSVKGYNVQAIFMHNGVMYAGLCSWESDNWYYQLFRVNLASVSAQ